jgi:DNA modification methylase
MQVLLECFSKPGDIVLDWTASTGMILITKSCHLFCFLCFQNTFQLLPLFAGASIRACQATGRHIIAFEDDADIFKAILQPLLSKPSTPRDTLKKPTRPTVEQRPAKKPKRNRIACA